jgi:hypothetical protein
MKDLHTVADCRIGSVRGGGSGRIGPMDRNAPIKSCRHTGDIGSQMAAVAGAPPCCPSMTAGGLIQPKSSTVNRCDAELWRHAGLHVQGWLADDGSMTPARPMRP